MSSAGQIPKPDLKGRKARCVCGRTAGSSEELRNFEYRGPGSRSANEVCVCGYHELAHHEDIRLGAVSPTLRNCPAFTPRGPNEYDAYWCGCEQAGDLIRQSEGA